jgi:predicted transcriptional regulator
MTPNEVLAHFESQSDIADTLGITRQSVSDWFTSGVVPELRQFQLELITRGKLKADVPVKQ